MATLKCFQGNLDGRRHGLVIASSQVSAAAVLDGAGGKAVCRRCSKILTTADVLPLSNLTE